MQLIETEGIWFALGFGWRELPSFLARYWLLLVATTALSVAIQHTPMPLGLLLAPFLSYLTIRVPATLYAKSLDDKPSSWSAEAIITFAVLALIESALFLPNALNMISSDLKILGTLLALPALWIRIKISGTPVFFIFASWPKSLGESLADSWNFVRGGTWWRLLFIQLLPGIIPAALYLTAFYALQFTLTAVDAGSLIDSTIFNAIAAVAYSWISLSIAALVSTASTIAAEPAKA